MTRDVKTKPVTRRPMKWMDDAPIRVTQSRHITASADAVFAVLADHEAWPQWFGALSAVEITGEPAGVGAERRVFIPGLGAIDEEFLVWEPGEAFGFSVIGMQRRIFVSLNELITIEPSGEGVLVTYTQAFDPKLWIALWWHIAARTTLPRALRKGLAGLANRVEAD